MDRARWQRLKSRFSSVMEMTSRRREKYLAASAGRPFASDLRKLIDEQDRADSFLDQPFWHDAAVGPPQTERALHVGEIILDRFEIGAFLGAGGMGEVYRAFDREMQQACALKTLRADVAARTALTRRLRKEVQLARRITHPNVCRLYDVGRAFAANGREIVFFTMELLEGARLSELTDRAISIREAAPIALQLLDGLQAAHEAGVIHRDLKSGNIFVLRNASGSPRVAITDFGLALEIRTGIRETISEFGEACPAGTPAYMAPEQVEGRRVTTASDLYAVGVILFEMVTGRLPFVGDSPLATALKRLREPPPDVRLFAPDVPTHWRFAISKCLETDATKRPKSATDVARILRGELTSPTHLGRRFAIAAAVTAVVGAPTPYLWRIYRASEEPGDAKRHYDLGTEFAKRRSREDLEEAVKEYNLALQIDPQHLGSLIGLVDVYTSQAGFNFVPSRQGIDSARDAALRAVKIAPDSAAAVGSLGWTASVDVKRWRQAERYLKRAVELDPKSTLLRRWYGGHLGKSGHFKEALEQVEAALKLDPVSMAVRHLYAAELFRSRHFEEFYRQCLELVRIQPLDASSYHALARAYEWRGEYDKALETCAQAEKLRNTPVARSIQACVEGARHNMAPAWKIAVEIDDLWRNQKFESNLLAGLWCRLEQPDRAAATLLAGFDRSDSTVITALTSPYFAPFASHPGFLKLKQQLDVG